MFAIIGLGNPGEKYKNNRHNVGYMMIDYIVDQVKSEKLKVQSGNLKFKTQNAFSSKIYHLGSKILLVKPLTFMNRSGIAVKKLLSNFQTFKLSNLIVIHDDLDIPLGKFKIQKGVGPKLHNGIESIENALGTKEFWRVRIGIDNRPALRSLGEGGVDGETYVLQNFTDLEQQVVLKTFSPILHRISSAII